MDLKVPILITVEQTEEIIHANGMLDLASGEIRQVKYLEGYDAESMGLPWDTDEYEFTSGTLSNNGKDVEFSININKTTGQYSVSATELLEVKLKAAALFAGMSGKDVAESAMGKPQSRKH